MKAKRVRDVHPAGVWATGEYYSAIELLFVPAIMFPTDEYIEPFADPYRFKVFKEQLD